MTPTFPLISLPDEACDRVHGTPLTDLAGWVTQGIAIQPQLPQVAQKFKVQRQRLEVIPLQPEHFQIPQLTEHLRDVHEAIVIGWEHLEVGEGTDRDRKRNKDVVLEVHLFHINTVVEGWLQERGLDALFLNEVQDLQFGDGPDLRWERWELIVWDIQSLKSSKLADLLADLCKLVVGHAKGHQVLHCAYLRCNGWENVLIQDEFLEVDEPLHIGWNCFNLVLTKIQELKCPDLTQLLWKVVQSGNYWKK